MKYHDIQAALEQRDFRQLEEAFTVFLDPPGEDDLEGFGSVVEMTDLFEQVCQALRTDDSVLPDRTAGIMTGVAGRFDRTFASRTYAAAVELAFTHLLYFRDQFERRLRDRASNG